MTDTTTEEWPDLSSWHQLPERTAIPAGMRYAEKVYATITISTCTNPWTPTSPKYFRTEHPITRPLPTEIGSIIRTGNGDLYVLIQDSPHLEGMSRTTSWCRVNGQPILMTDSEIMTRSWHELVPPR